VEPSPGGERTYKRGKKKKNSGRRKKEKSRSLITLLDSRVHHLRGCSTLEREDGAEGRLSKVRGGPGRKSQGRTKAPSTFCREELSNLEDEEDRQHRERNILDERGEVIVALAEIEIPQRAVSSRAARVFY